MNSRKLLISSLFVLFLSSCVFPIDFFDSSTLPTSEETSQTTTLPSSTSEEPSTTLEPTSSPTTLPTSEPTSVPTSEPSYEPTSEPTTEPTYVPTSEPTTEPTSEPTTVPTSDPTTEPSSYPTSDPTTEPSGSSTHPTRPTSEPTSEPTTYPTSDPTTYPTSESTSHSTSIPVDTSSSTLPDPVKAYYASITDDMMGEELLEALRDLNAQKRTSTVGYKAMGTNPSGYFKYTDYDPDYVQYDEKGQPYGTACVSFYSGHTMKSWNREHVWPNTHGGNKVEADIHMPRPTIPEENGSRGHSFYIEGMKTKDSSGWDPAMEDFGLETYRGDSARIIFYCMIATDQLVLVDDGSRSSRTNNNEMGVISDMLSWNLRYEVLQREQNRNSGAEYLQGNRNPFIDHPEYACRIWGLTNDKTRSICGM